MSTINQIIDVIAEPFGRPLDFAFREQIKIRVNNWRAKLIKESLNRNANQTRYLLSKIGVELEEVSETECPVVSDCTVLRSTVKIPKPIRLQGQLFDFVGTIDFKTAFSHGLPEQVEFFKYMKYFGLKPKYSLIDDYLFIFNPPTKELKWIGIRLIPENPEELNGFRCGDEQKCYTDDEPYPIPLDLLPTVIKAVTDEIRQMQNNKPEQIPINGIQEKI